MLQIITASTPLYLEPDQTSNRETDALFGESVQILAENGPWCEVILRTDGYQGWIHRESLGEGLPPTHYVAVPRGLMTVTPDIKSPAAGILPLMALVAADEAEADVMAIRNPAGITGYLPARHLRPLGSPVSDWVATAESLMGTPYRWGGRDSIGIDCSALVQLALATGGYKVMRNSSDQEKTLGSTIVSSAELTRGDLVFWKGHVGIMTDPETLLHANMHHAMTAKEPLAEAVTRLEKLDLPVTRFARV